MNAALLILVVALPCAAQDALREASERFQRGDAAGAADAYEVAIGQGADGADVFYNLGTSALRAGDTGRAVWALMEARARAPNDADVLFNLDLARRSNPDTVVGVQESAAASLLARIPRPWLQWGALAAWWLLCGLLVARGILGARRLLDGAILRAVPPLALLGLLLAAVETTAGTPSAVVVAREAVVRSTESAVGPEAFRVHAGLAVEPVMELPSGLTRIRLDNGLEGFVESTALRRVGR